jgi:hypothetical protein
MAFAKTEVIWSPQVANRLNKATRSETGYPFNRNLLERRLSPMGYSLSDGSADNIQSFLQEYVILLLQLNRHADQGQIFLFLVQYLE